MIDLDDELNNIFLPNITLQVRIENWMGALGLGDFIFERTKIAKPAISLDGEKVRIVDPTLPVEFKVRASLPVCLEDSFPESSTFLSCFRRVHVKLHKRLCQLLSTFGPKKQLVCLPNQISLLLSCG